MAGTVFQMDSAYQGQEGYALVREAVAAGRPYAMVFMDVRMPPGWDGIETTLKIWELDPQLEIVICTAYSDYSWDEMIAKLGISDRLVILKKPFDNVEVRQLAHALTEKWSLRRQAQARMEQLEEMVAARTHELQAANEQLKTEMTERARTEETLRQSQKMEALGQLAGGIAHDFNNLLTVIRGYAQILLADAAQKSAVLEPLRQIDGAAERAAKLTAQMLMFSHKRRIQPQDLNLNETLAQLKKMLPRIIREDIVIEIQCDETPLPVHADPVMIEQVLLNLAVNARDAMPAGGHLWIKADEIGVTEEAVRRNPKARPGRFARISVSDDGCGIAPDALPHLFEPFFTTKEPGKGTGLGLASAYGIVKQHDGWIEVECGRRKGAGFNVFLPLSAKKTGPVATPQLQTSLPRGRETILLVEDETALRRLARGILQRQGYQVHEAGCGQEALSMWQKHGGEIDLLLTDMIMPGCWSGRELAERLQREKPGLKVTYSTGYSREAIGCDWALEEGVNFLPKPYQLHKLVQTVRRLPG